MAEIPIALVGGCSAAIGALLKWNATKSQTLAEAMSVTPTTPVDQVRAGLRRSGGSSQCEMYGESWAAEPVEYKGKPCLVKKELTHRLYNTHRWVKPQKHLDENNKWKVLKDGYYQKIKCSEVMSCDVTGDEQLQFREVGTAAQLSGGAGDSFWSSEETPAVVTVAPDVSIEPFYVTKGNSFEPATGVSVNVNVNGNTSQPPDEPLGIRRVTKVIPMGKQLYALGQVQLDGDNLVLSKHPTEPFVLMWGSEEAVCEAMYSEAANRNLAGNILLLAGGLCVSYSVASLASGSSRSSSS